VWLIARHDRLPSFSDNLHLLLLLSAETQFGCGSHRLGSHGPSRPRRAGANRQTRLGLLFNPSSANTSLMLVGQKYGERGRLAARSNRSRYSDQTFTSIMARTTSTSRNQLDRCELAKPPRVDRNDGYGSSVVLLLYLDCRSSSFDVAAIILHQTIWSGLDFRIETSAEMDLPATRELQLRTGYEGRCPLHSLIWRKRQDRCLDTLAICQRRKIG
jgi:hypothetical protein